MAGRLAAPDESIVLVPQHRHRLVEAAQIPVELRQALVILDPEGPDQQAAQALHALAQGGLVWRVRAG